MSDSSNFYVSSITAWFSFWEIVSYEIVVSQLLARSPAFALGILFSCFSSTINLLCGSPPLLLHLIFPPPFSFFLSRFGGFLVCNSILLLAYSHKSKHRFSFDTTFYQPQVLLNSLSLAAWARKCYFVWWLREDLGVPRSLLKYSSKSVDKCKVFTRQFLLPL